MQAELYQKLFARLDSLGAIRKNEELSFIKNEQHRSHAPILSDLIVAIRKRWPTTLIGKCPRCGYKMEHDPGQEPSHPETGQWDIEPSNYCSKWCNLSNEDASDAMVNKEFESIWNLIWNDCTLNNFDMSKPNLIDQSDEFGNELLSILQHD